MTQSTYPSYRHRVVYLQNSRQLQITLADQVDLTTRIPFGCTLTGRTITTPLGESLFDFCYADFSGIHQYWMHDGGRSYLLETASVPFASTLYAALFPDQSRDADSLEILQAEFLDLLQFCCDADYEPEVLGDLTAADRYALWSQIHDRSTETVHAEVICTGPIQVQCFPEKGAFRLSSAQQSFALRHGLHQAAMVNAIRHTQVIQHAHLCSSLEEMLRLEFTRLLEENVQTRRCRRCGRYFLVKGNYPSLYCTRIAEGRTQTCQQLAAASTFHSKLKDNDGDNAWGVYSKYYKRYYARIKRGALTATEFKQWQEDAARMRDRCLDGKMTLDEYRNWLDRYFQNPSISCPYASHIQCDAVCIGRGKTTTTRIV